MNDQSRSFSDKVCLEVGRKVLEAYNTWTEKPRGIRIVIPVKIPNQRSDQPPWCMNIECDMPWFIENYVENGEYKSKHWSLKEWLNTRGDNGQREVGETPAKPGNGSKA